MRLLPLAGALCLIGAAAAPGIASAEPSVDTLAAEAALQSTSMPRAVPAARQDSDIVNDEIVVSELDPRGLPVTSSLISRISSKPGEQRVIKDPTSTTNIIYLNQRGQPTIDADGDGIEVTVGGPQGTTTLTQSLVDKPLSVAMHAEYAMNGEVVDPEVVVGASGDLTITYTVTNTDVEQTELTYKNAVGQETTEKQPVFAPFVGTLTASLPESMQVTDTKDAIVTTDKEGNTLLLWQLLLYPPMGDYEQKVSFRAQTESGTIPAVLLNVVPVTTQTDPSLKFTTDLFEKTADGNEQLASGLEQLNNQTIQLAQGAAQLASGIGQLAAASGAISSGFNNEFVPGTTQLAAGADSLASGQEQLAGGLGSAATGAQSLASGSQELTSGLAQLADGLDQLAGNFPEIVTGADRIRKGAAVLSKAVGSPSDKPIPGPSPTVPPSPTPIPTPSNSPIFPTPTPTATPTPTKVPSLVSAVKTATNGAEDLAEQTVILNNNLVKVLAKLNDAAAASGQVSSAVDSAQTNADAAYATLCAVPADPGCAELDAARTQVDAAKAANTQVSADLATSIVNLTIEGIRAYVIAQGSNELAEALDLIRGGVEAVALGLSTGTDTPPGLVEALGELVDGLDQADSAIQQLSSGATSAASGSKTLTGGTDQLAGALGQAATGADQLASGAAQLASGAQGLAFGSAEVGSALNLLTTGTESAANGSAELATGASMLQSKGTAKVYESVVASSDQPALATAFLKASSDRAGSALPYGLPEGATGSVAYVMTMAPVAPSGSAPWQFAAMGLLLLGAGGGAVAKNWAATRTP